MTSLSKISQLVLCVSTLAAGTFGAATGAQAATLYVNGATGSDDNVGTSALQPLKTIQKACGKVAAGDTVIVSPGVYFEHVQLTKTGTAEAPITFKADSVQKGRVIVSAANAPIRQGQAVWTLEDAATQLYSTPLEARPARVLYDNVDLLPYPSLECLKQFRLPWRTATDYPGALHGFTLEDGRLYVRLHEGGTYGPTDPAKHVMAVSPPIGRGHVGMFITGSDDTNYYNWAVIAKGPANVIIDGFTFETPGSVGVYTRGDNVTVRNCWFYGCRAAVGSVRSVKADPKTANKVTVEYCDWGQYPAFNDMKEVIAKYKDDPFRGDKKQLWQQIYWWQRKGGSDPGGGLGYQNSYEVGICNAVGDDWVIRNNRIHDTIDGISGQGTEWSRNLQIYGNRFEGCIDNAVESENHAQNLRIFGNEIVDVFEPFSWQPLSGLPWPGPVYVYGNMVWNTPETAAAWKSAGWTPGVWKFAATERNWKAPADRRPEAESAATADGEGFVSYNNTVFAPDSFFLTRPMSKERKLANFHFFNNLVVVGDFCPSATNFAAEFDFKGNVAAFDAKAPMSADANATVVANGGAAMPKNIRPAVEQSLVGKSAPALPVTPAVVANLPEQLSYVGAVAPGKAWAPLVVGPVATAK